MFLLFLLFNMIYGIVIPTGGNIYKKTLYIPLVGVQSIETEFSNNNLIYIRLSGLVVENGTAKYILRDAFKGKISNKILFDSPKRGFNFNILRYLKIKKNYDELMELFESKSNPIYEFLKYNDVKKMLKSKKMLNSENKFIFSVINLSLFLKNK